MEMSQDIHSLPFSFLINKCVLELPDDGNYDKIMPSLVLLFSSYIFQAC